jgi:tRNA G18 (ribose-2'-O)-methylase SpoU
MYLDFLTSADDSRLDPYRSLKESNSTRDAGGFIAEGRRLFARLLDADWPLESVLVSDRDLETGTAPLLARLDEAIPVFVLPADEVKRLIGFSFHRGVLVRAKHKPPSTLESVALTAKLIVCCSALRDPSNLGSIFRSAAAFGWDAAIVAPSTPDAFSRRTLRTSMGGVLRMEVVMEEDELAAVRRLRNEFGFAVYAAEATNDAIPFDRLQNPERLALLLGNEDAGLPPALLAECDAVAAIPMTDRVESLNVAVAGGILLQRFGSIDRVV